MTTQKKQYEKPSMQVFKLKQQQTLLAGSVGAGRDDYGPAIEDTWSNSPASPFNNLPGLDVLNILPKE